MKKSKKQNIMNIIKKHKMPLIALLVVIVSLNDAIKNKNISLGKTIRKLWDYLAACSCFWYLGSLILMFAY